MKTKLFDGWFSHLAVWADPGTLLVQCCALVRRWRHFQTANVISAQERDAKLKRHKYLIRLPLRAEHAPNRFSRTWRHALAVQFCSFALFRILAGTFIFMFPLFSLVSCAI